VVAHEVEHAHELLEWEQFWIDKLKPHFNKCPIAGSPMTGRKHTPEALAKIAQASQKMMMDPRQREIRSLKGKGRKRKPESVAKSVLGLTKGYELTSPLGVKQIVRNLKQFCRDHNMSSSNFAKVAQGVWRQYNGWKCRYLTVEEREGLFAEPPAQPLPLT
jgi:hypothetical protein